jgi:mono/diheme cytochrome c family protein
MIKLPHLSDEDLHAIIAFLRSDDPLVRPADVASVPSRPSLLVKLLSRVAWKPLPYPDKPIVAPSWNDRVAYGRYLTHNLGCFACHSQDFRKLDALHPEKSAGYLGGGNRLLDINGREIVAPNITFDRETGIGRWTEPQFVRAIRAGFRPDGKPILYPMLPSPELSIDEVRALYAYLKTVPVLHNRRPPAQELVLTADASEGQRIYFKYSCHSCHGLDGVGVADLRPANRKYKHDAELAAWIKHPSKLRPGTKMPDWDGVIPEAELKPLVAYVRSLGR